VADLVQGLTLGLDGMREGGRRRITIPPDLAYGTEAITDRVSGATLIPASATIIYEIQLIEVRETAGEDER
jgi:FKBP-type peptidyl-prolyl cis-trans isomerase